MINTTMFFGYPIKSLIYWCNANVSDANLDDLKLIRLESDSQRDLIKSLVLPKRVKFFATCKSLPTVANILEQADHIISYTASIWGCNCAYFINLATRIDEAENNMGDSETYPDELVVEIIPIAIWIIIALLDKLTVVHHIHAGFFLGQLQQRYDNARRDKTKTGQFGFKLIAPELMRQWKELANCIAYDPEIKYAVKSVCDPDIWDTRHQYRDDLKQLNLTEKTNG